MTPYEEFLARKELVADEDGVVVDPDTLHPYLYEWQRRIVAWALHVGRAAVGVMEELDRVRNIPSLLDELGA